MKICCFTVIMIIYSLALLVIYTAFIYTDILEGQFKLKYDLINFKFPIRYCHLEFQFLLKFNSISFLMAPVLCCHLGSQFETKFNLN